MKQVSFCHVTDTEVSLCLVADTGVLLLCSLYGSLLSVQGSHSSDGRGEEGPCAETEEDGG